MRILLKNRSLLTGKYDSSLKNKTIELVVGINSLFMKALWEQSPWSLFLFMEADTIIQFCTIFLLIGVKHLQGVPKPQQKTGVI